MVDGTNGMTISIVEYTPERQKDFARLNLDWLERYFSVEPIDRDVLAAPQQHILAGGGRILFAVEASGVTVGTVALLNTGGGVYELTKMAVDPEWQGVGVGRKLMEAVLALYATLEGKELYLESSSKLAPALRLYESVGFRHHPAPRAGSHYQRADVHMIWEPS